MRVEGRALLLLVGNNATNQRVQRLLAPPDQLSLGGEAVRSRHWVNYERTRKQGNSSSRRKVVLIRRIVQRALIWPSWASLQVEATSFPS